MWTVYYPLDDFAGPDVFVLQDADRFHAILHSGEIRLADGTTMILLIVFVHRSSGGRWAHSLLSCGQKNSCRLNLLRQSHPVSF
jgi:hypothetical protein